MDITELTRSAEAGRCAAQTTLGLYYLHGYEALEVNYKEAFRWLSIAAERGASRAIANLGDMYAQGLGTDRDISKANQLYEQVGKVEFFAALELGRNYSRGTSVPANRDKALEWYSVAAGFETVSFDYESLREELREAKEYVDSIKDQGSNS